MIPTHRNQALAMVICLAGLFAMDSSGQPTSPRFAVTLVPPPPDFDYFEPRRVNDRGDMVGRLDASSGPYHDDSHAGLYSDGVSIDFHLLVSDRGHDVSLPVALNDRGQVLFRGLGPQPEHAYLYQSGGVQDLTELTGYAGLDAQAINNSGQIVGAIQFADHSVQAFAFANGTVQLLRKPHSKRPDSAAMAVNDDGIIVGAVFDESSDTVDSRPALFSNKQTTTLRMPYSYAVDVNAGGSVLIVGHQAFVGAQGVLWMPDGTQVKLPFSPTGMNDNGQVVGWLTQPQPPRPFLYSGNVTHNLNDLIDPASGWQLLYAFDINNRGQIVGLGKLNGLWSGFLLSPVAK